MKIRSLQSNQRIPLIIHPLYKQTHLPKHYCFSHLHYSTIFFFQKNLIVQFHLETSIFNPIRRYQYPFQSTMKHTFLLLLLISIVYSQIQWGPCPPMVTKTTDIATQIVERVRDQLHKKFPDPLEVWGPVDTQLLQQVPTPQCANISVPLDWNNPTGPKIKYFIRRFRALADRKKGQLWMQQGGPGMYFSGEFILIFRWLWNSFFDLWSKNVGTTWWNYGYYCT